MVDVWQQKQREARIALAVGAALLVCPDPIPAEGFPGHVHGCRECGEATDHVVRWNGKAATLCPACALAIREV